MRLPAFLVVCSLLALAGVALLAIPPSEPPPVAPSGSSAHTTVVVRDGVKLEWELRDSQSHADASSHRSAVATLTLSDARTGEPIRRARPRAWMDRTSGEAAEGEACKAKIRSYLGGLLAVQAQVDLNAAWLLVMNDDNTVSVLNPHVAFSRTKLRSILTLPGRAADWVLHPDGSTLYVSIPETGQLSLIDTRRFSSRGLLRVGEGARRLLLSPDSRRLFITREEAGRVAVVDAVGQLLAGELEVEPGRLSLAFAQGGRELYVASDRSASIHVFDSVTLESLGTIAGAEGVIALAHHDAAGAVFAANERSGEISIIDPDQRRVTARIPLQQGVSKLGLDPSGRWLLALNSKEGELTAIDAASRTVRATWDKLGTPDALTFTREFVYVRDTGAPRIFLARLDALNGSGQPGVSEIQIGQVAPGSMAAASEAAPFVRTIEGDGVFVASPKDRALFFYMEGMMAPMGTLRNNGREPRAVLLLDRALREVQPGVYRTDVELGASGTWDVSVLVDSPRVALCLQEEVAPSDKERQQGPEHQVTVKAAFDVSLPLAAGAEHALPFIVSDAALGEVKPEEVEVLAFRPPGTWQWRGTARRGASEALEVVLPPAPEGQLTLLLGVPARGAPLGSLSTFQLAISGTGGEPAAVATEIAR